MILQHCAPANGGTGIERADIDQVGALPYRIMPDGSAQVMLITSRDTGRWVIPKGNPITGLDDLADRLGC